MKSFWVFFRITSGVVGIIFILVLINEILIPGPENDIGMNISGPTTAGSPQFITALSHLINVPSQTGEDITIIPEGQEFLPQLIQAIDQASASIDFTTYPWSEGTMSSEVLSALTNAAQRGVSVRVLIDALGGHTVSDRDLLSLQNAGADVERYHSFSLLNPLQYNERDHMRSIVIDGKIGFFGGMGIGDDWTGDGITSGWSDIMFEVKNEMAQSLQGAFTSLWNRATGEVLAGENFYPSLSRSSSLANSSSTNTFLNIVSIPSQNDEPVRDTFLYSIMNAQKSIYIISPFIIPDADIVAALENKARSGVDVEIISPGDKTNAPILRDAWRSNYTNLLAAGVKIYEYEPQMIHTKIMIIDGTWSIVGSANLDSRSEMLNDENIMGVQDPDFAAQLKNIFTQDVSYSEQITQQEWSAKSFIVKAWYHFLTLFEKQL